MKMTFVKMIVCGNARKLFVKTEALALALAWLTDLWQYLDRKGAE